MTFMTIVIKQITHKLLTRDSLTVLCPKIACDNYSDGLFTSQKCEVLVAAPLLVELGAGLQNPAHFLPNFVVPLVSCCMLSLSSAIEKPTAL